MITLVLTTELVMSASFEAILSAPQNEIESARAAGYLDGVDYDTLDIPAAYF